MTFYVTTPIYYVNAEPHLGHAYTTMVADALARFHRLLGEETRFQTGTDEHGDKVLEAARKAGLPVREFVDRISETFRQTWDELKISYDVFVRTTQPSHVRLVQTILKRLYDQGDIYFGEYGGLYCFGCERFYLERELVDGKCPDHQTAPTFLKEENYFFRLSRHQEWLLGYIEDYPDWIRPERYRNEVLGFLREPLEDLCISRPKQRLSWGITLPFDERYVAYVWFDALLNYITGLDYPEGPLYQKFWPAAQHLIAKDILKPHAIYWPIMLRAAGIPPFRHLNVHGYWQVASGKMSKTLGNVVEPRSLAAIYGLDQLRYFFLREMVYGLDATFSEEALRARINADLANDLGNLFSRSLGMAFKYRKGVVPPPGDPEAADREVTQMAREVAEDFLRLFPELEFPKALARVWEFVGFLNRYIVNSSPWELAKDPGAQTRLDTVLYHLLEGLRWLATLLRPVMPERAEKMGEQLGQTPIFKEQLYSQALTWGGLTPGTLLKRGPALFPRWEEPLTVSQPATHP
jgi:methionyl-tRNA synthetase|uniref:Methionine--tRNA ligase n=1 Tax=Desulfobacca acetoxidans TaxID=60893 RepID=A0A7C5EQ17_9BACT